MNMDLITTSGVKGFIDEKGTAWLSLEDVAKGLGFTQVKNHVEYVRWETVGKYLNDFEFSQQVGKEGFIPENIFYLLAMKASNQTAVAFQMKVASEILPSIRKTGSYSAKPISPTEALLQSVQILAQQEREIQQIKLQASQTVQQLSVLGERVANLDSVDLIGDLQQRLNAMIRKYARDNGVAYNVAWSEFTKAYNTAYRANLTALKANYEEKHGRSVTRPQFLAAVGKLEDALRVADKMLNKAG